MSDAQTMLKVSAFIVAGIVLIGLAVPEQGIPLTSETGAPSDPKNTTGGAEDDNVSTFLRGLQCTVGLGLVVIFGTLDACKSFISGVLGSDSGIAKVALMSINAIQQLANALAAFFTFDIPGAPGWVRVLIAVPLNITLLYMIIQVLPTT